MITGTAYRDQMHSAMAAFGRRPEVRGTNSRSASSNKELMLMLGVAAVLRCSQSAAGTQLRLRSMLNAMILAAFFGERLESVGPAFVSEWEGLGLRTKREEGTTTKGYSDATFVPITAIGGTANSNLAAVCDGCSSAGQDIAMHTARTEMAR